MINDRKKMKTVAAIFFLSLVIISCNANEPEEIYLRMDNLQVTASATSIPNTDSVFVSVDFSFDYEFINCRGMIEHYWKSFPDGKGSGGPIETLTSTVKDTWNDGYDKKYKRPIPEKYLQEVFFQGRIYKDANQNYEEFSKLISKEVIIKKNY